MLHVHGNGSCVVAGTECTEICMDRMTKMIGQNGQKQAVEL